MTLDCTANLCSPRASPFRKLIKKKRINRMLLMIRNRIGISSLTRYLDKFLWTRLRDRPWLRRRARQLTLSWLCQGIQTDLRTQSPRWLGRKCRTLFFGQGRTILIRLGQLRCLKSHSTSSPQKTWTRMRRMICCIRLLSRRREIWRSRLIRVLFQWPMPRSNNREWTRQSRLTVKCSTLKTWNSGRRT